MAKVHTKRTMLDDGRPLGDLIKEEISKVDNSKK